MVSSLIVLLDITAMINILQEVVKTLHDKILKTLNWYWLRDNATEKNNSLNGHSNEPRILG